MQQHDESVIDGFIILIAHHVLKNIKVVTTDIGLDLDFALATSEPDLFAWE